MERELKARMNITLMPDNANWLQQMSKKTGIPMSLFIDSMVTGMRVSTKEGVTEREAMSMAFEQIAKGIRK